MVKTAAACATCSKVSVELSILIRLFLMPANWRNALDGTRELGCSLIRRCHPVGMAEDATCSWEMRCSHERTQSP